ncbi:MAG: hypothetical protein LKF75_03740 [Bacilli bacterium]|jgi:hypothetical protein|nr:hypothetical protein [Bacilli bacterium]MCH4278236.1 hypothetical protein [Bacilli bacterium]
MKKRIFVMAATTLLALAGLAACEPADQSSTPGPDSTPTTSDNTTSNPTTSDEPTSNDSNSQPEVITHRNEWTKSVPEGAITRDYDKRFDEEVEDFSTATLAGSSTVNVHNGFLRSVVDSNLDSFSKDAGSAIYKVAAGTFEAMNLGTNGIGFRMRVKEGKLSLSNLVLELRGDDAFKTYPIQLSAAKDGDGEALPELTSEYQDFIINPGQTIEDADTVYTNTDGTASSTKVLDKIVGFHLRANDEEVSAVLDIDEVFTYTGTTRTTLDDFNREELNKIPGAWWGGNDSGASILVRKGLSLAGGASYTTADLDATEAAESHIVMSLLGDSSGATVTVKYTDDSTVSHPWSELKAKTSNSVVSTIDGAYINLAIDVSVFGEKTIKNVSIANSGTNPLEVSNVFVTSFEEPSLDLSFPRLDTENSVTFDNFNRTINSLGTDWDASAALSANVDAGINGFVSYNHGADIKTDGSDLLLPAAPSPDYDEVTIGSQHTMAGAQYIVFAIKGEEGYDASEFRFQIGSQSTLYLNQAHAAEGVKTINGDVENPYLGVDGYDWYVVDLNYEKMTAGDLINMYYTGDKAIKVGSIFYANQASSKIEGASNDVSANCTDINLADYHYVGGLDNFASAYYGIDIKGDGTATFDSLRVEYNGATKWIKDGEVVGKLSDGTALSKEMVIPTSETTLWIDVKASGYSVASGTAHLHVGGGFTGVISVSKLHAADNGYKETYTGGAVVTIPAAGGYTYGFGIVTTNAVDRLYFTLSGDGTENLKYFRLEYNSKTLYPGHEGAEHLTIHKASDGSELSSTDAVPSEAALYYVDFAENGYVAKAGATAHFHFNDAADVGGVLTFSDFYGTASVLPYSASASGYSDAF